jgi:hypothetical protein
MNKYEQLKWQSLPFFVYSAVWVLYAIAEYTNPARKIPHFMSFGFKVLSFALTIENS